MKITVWWNIEDKSLLAMETNEIIYVCSGFGGLLIILVVVILCMKRRRTLNLEAQENVDENPEYADDYYEDTSQVMDENEYYAT